MSETAPWPVRHAALIGFIWGMAEASVFFIVPDVAVAFIALISPRDWWKAALGSILGTLLAATLLFLAVQLWLHDEVHHWLTVIPGIHASTLVAAQHRIAATGSAALLGAAFSGIPFKVYAAELTLGGTSLPILLAWTIPSRALRVLPVAGAAGIIGVIFRQLITRHRRRLIAVYIVGWILFYGWYWSRPAL